MRMNDFHIQLATAYPGAQKVDTKKGNTIYAQLETDEGLKTAYVKLLRTEDIAKEALCAVLARKLHIPVKQPYYVDVSNTEYAGKSNKDRVAFGLQDDHGLTSRVRANDPIITAELLKWPDLLRCAIYDEWIANSDRYPNNLLFEINGLFWLIDHEEALPGYASPSTPVSSQLLELMVQEKSEFELYKIRDDALKFVEEYKTIDWDEIYELLLPKNLPGGSKHFAKYIEFLKARIPEMRDILTENLGIKQKELQFNKSGKTSAVKKK